MDNFSDTLNEVMDDNIINAEHYSANNYASQDEIDCERDIMGTNPYDDYVGDSNDENIIDMSIGRDPSERFGWERDDEYADEEEDDYIL